MSIPALPFKLSPLNGPPRAKPSTRRQKQPDVEEDSSDTEGCSDIGEGTEDEPANAMGCLDIDDNDDVGLSDSIASASADAARDSALDAAHEEMRGESKDILKSTLRVLELPQSTTMSSLEAHIQALSLLNNDGTLSIQRMLDIRQAHQRATEVRSQRTVMLDPKFS